jgi:hypothetical protein
LSITIEEREQIKDLGVKKHMHLVDGYIASGLDMDDLTIHYAVDQERIQLVLRGYGFYPDPWSKEQFDSRRKYKGIPYHFVEEFITAFYPGILADETETEQVTLENFLDRYHPGWRNSQHLTRSSLFHLSDEELQGKGYYDHPAKPSKKRNGLLDLLRKK